MSYIITYAGRVVASAKSKTIACGLITAFDGVDNDDWQLLDYELRPVSKIFGRGPMTHWRDEFYKNEAWRGVNTRTSWGNHKP